MVRISQYIDDQPTVFMWDLDEAIVFGSIFGLAMAFTNDLKSLFIAMVIGLIARSALARTKKTRSEGFFLHYLYWHGLINLKGVIPSYYRDFTE